MTSTAASVRKQIAAEQKQDKEDKILLKREQYSNMVSQWKNRKRTVAKPGYVRVCLVSIHVLILMPSEPLDSARTFATRFWTCSVSAAGRKRRGLRPAFAPWLNRCPCLACCSETDWDIFWTDKQWIRGVYDRVHLDNNQRVNHFRNYYEVRTCPLVDASLSRLFLLQIARKDCLIKNLKRTKRTLARKGASLLQLVLSLCSLLSVCACV